MSGIGKFKNRRISCIANNSERYITFGLSGLQFIDSLQFTNSSLERLVDNLTREEFQFLHKYIDGQQKQDLMLRKGVYPYDYVDKPAKLEEKRLPPKQEFYSKLYDEDISDSDYQHAKDVWSAFNCETLGDYHDIYLKSDVLLLADVFEDSSIFMHSSFAHMFPTHISTQPRRAFSNR